MDIRRITAVMTAAAVLSIGYQPPYAQAEETAAEILDITKFTVHDENLVHLGAGYLRGVEYLFDDQDKVPVSLENMKVDSDVWEATSRKNWTPNQQMEYGEASFYIDFGANYEIYGAALLDTNGTPVWTISDGEPFSWNEIAVQTMDTYNSWRAIKFDKPRLTRYMRFSSDYCDTGVSELAIYGRKVSELSDAQKAKTAPETSPSRVKLTAGQKAGFNAFIDDPLTAMMAGGNVREYHNFSWLLDDSGKVKFTQGTWGDMDSYYKSLKDRGISVIPCFQGGSAVISGASKSVPEIPVKAGADTLDPASYALHAQAMYQVAARYGSVKVPEDTINITDAQEVRTGLGLLDALENSNEPNKSWAGKANYFTPYELAAMCSADYDGHEGRIKNAGVKTADPDFRLAVGGLLTPQATLLTYLDEMKLWFDYNRSDGKFAVDILNIHLGPDDVCIEESSFRSRVAEIQEWIDKNAPDTELWISEFEIPMSDCAEEGTDAHDSELYQLRYAQRCTRTYLAAIAQGVDRITKFQLRDEGEGVYYNSGLVTGKGEWSKKQAWYQLACLTNILKNSDFVSETSDNGVDIMEFRDRDNGDIIKCLWSPTNSGVTIKNYKLAVGAAEKVYLTVPSEFVEGTASELEIKNGAVTLDVGETPVYVTLSSGKRTFINGRNSQIRPAEISLDIDKTQVCGLDKAPADKTLGQFYRMFDEPNTMPDPIYGDTKGMKTPETNVNQSGITAYAFFEKPCVFNGFAVYDTYGTGGIEVYDAYTEKLLWSSDLGGYMYRAVSFADDALPTDCVKIVKKGGDMNELAFYGYEAQKSWDVDDDGIVDSLDLAQMRRIIVSGSRFYAVSDLVGISKFILGE